MHSMKHVKIAMNSRATLIMLQLMMVGIVITPTKKKEEKLRVINY